jgi:hypothetical protein
VDPVVAVGFGVLWVLFSAFGRKKRPPVQPKEGRPTGKAMTVPRPSSAPRLTRAPSAENVVDFDDEAEQIAARRIASIEENARPRTAPQRVRLDERIRPEPADATATARVSMAQLRSAMLWREILGPPVSLRDSADS